MRIYTRTRPLTFDERIAAILDLADSKRGLLKYVLLQLHRQAVSKTLLQAISSTTLVMSTNHHTREERKLDRITNVDQELKHLVRPLLLTDISASAPTTTEIDSIAETASCSLIRNQKGHNYDPSLENPVLPPLFGSQPVDLEGYIPHTYTASGSSLPLNAPFYLPLTDDSPDTPRRDLIGSWSQRPCRPGSSCSNTTFARGTGDARPQPVRVARCRAKTAPYTSPRRTPAR